MKITKRTILPLLLIFSIIASCFCALSASALDGTEDVSLNIVYEYDKIKIKDAEFNLYYVASIDSGCNFTLDGEFKTCPVDINLGSSDYPALAMTIYGYVRLYDYTPTYTVKTDSNGEIKLTTEKDALKQGMYLVTSSKTRQDNYEYTTKPYLVSLPSFDSQMLKFKYDVISYPKVAHEKIEDTDSTTETDTHTDTLSETDTHTEPASETDTHTDPASETDTHTDPTSETDTHTEPGSETDTHTDPASEPDTHTDPASEPDTHTDPASEPDTHTDPASEPDTHTDPASEPDTHTDPASETDTHTEPASETDTHTEPASETDTHTEPVSETDTHTDPVSETDTHTEPASETDTHTEPASETDTHTEPVSETDTHTDTEEHSGIVTVKKVWADLDDPDRPDSVTINLLKDGEVYKTIVLSESNNWVYRWENLSKGHEWLVVEEPVKGYTVLVSSNSKLTEVKNTKIPPDTESDSEPKSDTDSNPKKEDPSSKPSLPQTGSLWWAVAVTLSAGLIMYWLGYTMRKNTGEDE